MGGVEKFLLMLGDALRSNGVQVTYVVTQCKGAWHDRVVNEGFEVVTVLPSKWQSPRRHAFRIAAALKNADAVLVNHCPTTQSIIGELSASCLVMTILHNDEEMVYRVGLGNVPRTDYIVCVSSKITSEALRRGTPAEKVVHFPHGVDVPLSFPKDDTRGDGRPLKLIYVGRIDHEQKGVFDIPPILQEAQRQGAAMTLDVVGDGEPDLTTMRQEFARDLPKFPVVFHGRIDNTQVHRLLKESDILLMPSRYEGLPVALLEALAYGVIPIASRLQGVTDDAVTDGVNGILPPVGDITGFARAIVSLQNNELRQRMSHAAWQTASSEFTKDAMAGRYLQLLNRGRSQTFQQGDTPDRIGRKLFGRSWYFPIGLTNAIRAQRRARKSIR
jgi:glycosyltransferase involved in cell wall biosynthesis